MKVYIVSAAFEYEGYTNIRVFSNQEKAIAYVKEQSSDSGYDYWSVEEWEVDSEAFCTSVY